jgi:hypothetical protein
MFSFTCFELSSCSGLVLVEQLFALLGVSGRESALEEVTQLVPVLDDENRASTVAPPPMPLIRGSSINTVGEAVGTPHH